MSTVKKVYLVGELHVPSFTYCMSFIFLGIGVQDFLQGIGKSSHYKRLFYILLQQLPSDKEVITKTS